MNERYDEQGRPADDATTPADEAEQAEISGLLGAVSGPVDAETMPSDVAARLDDVLAGLVAERTAGPAAGPVPADEVVGVTDLGRRRRKPWPALLVAAAAVSVVGLGVGNVLDLGGGAGMEAASTADDATAGGAVAPESTDSDSDHDAGNDRAEGGEAEQAPHPVDEKLVAALADLPALRSGSLAVDVQRVVDFTLGGSTERQLRRACVRPDLAEGDEWLSVRFDRKPAVLVLRAPEDGRRTAEVFGCDDGDTAVAETTVQTR